MENYDKIINQLQAELLNAKKAIIGGGRAIDESRCLELISALRENLPKDLIEALYILRDRDDIIVSAKQQANDIIHSATEKAQTLVMNSEIVKRASIDADNMVADAQQYTARLENETKISIKGMFDEAEDRIADLLTTIRESREDFMNGALRRGR